MPWEWSEEKGQRVFRPPTAEEIRANLLAANEQCQSQIERARAALEETIANRDALAARCQELEAVARSVLEWGENLPDEYAGQCGICGCDFAYHDEDCPYLAARAALGDTAADSGSRVRFDGEEE
jgi:hypothetical protein